MSEANVEIVKALQPSGIDLVAALKRGADPFALVPRSALTDDFEAAFLTQDAPAMVPFRGAEGFVAGWLDWLEPWANYEIHAEKFIDAGDRVVVFARVRGRTHRDDVEMEHAPAAIWTLRDGLACRIELYLNPSEALKAVGLEE